MEENKSFAIMKHVKKLNDSNSTFFETVNGVPYIKFRNLSEFDDEIVHGFSTRLGGVSREHLASMNLSFTRGDAPDHVLENHRRFANAVGYDYRKLVCSDQVHLTNIRNCTSSDCGKGIIKESDIRETDGLLTDEPGVPLITFYADCVPLFFYCPVKRVAALAHSGWRGTVAGIGTKMIQRMVSDYGCRPEDIRCAIGPSICRNCYEVSEDVAAEFKKEYKASELAAMVTEKGNGKYLLDLQLACRYNFLRAGVQDKHISTADICTCCNPELLYSHRASHGMRGNLGAVIMLKTKENI